MAQNDTEKSRKIASVISMTQNETNFSTAAELLARSCHFGGTFSSNTVPTGITELMQKSTKNYSASEHQY